MFPAGAAGIALTALRLSAALDLLAYGSGHSVSALSLAFLALPAGALCLGFATPYASGIGCAVELAALIRTADPAVFPTIVSIVNTAALGMLGPGAYSLDARFFGRRVLRFSTSRDSQE
jgi:hypothetical protein